MSVLKKYFEKIGEFISSVINLFYPPFRNFVSPQFFKYGVTGASNIIFDWVLYYLVFHYLLNEDMLHLPMVTLSSHIAAMIIVFPFTFLTGFLLQKYVTFTASEMRGRVQIVRYLSVVLANILINYIGLKLFVDVLQFYPTPSKMLVTVITTIFSYISQRKYAFKTK